MSSVRVTHCRAFAPRVPPMADWLCSAGTGVSAANSFLSALKPALGLFREYALNALTLTHAAKARRVWDVISPK